MRGLAAVIMLQGHILDGWVRAEDRSGEWFWLSQFLGGLPAPIFLFLVGASLALVLNRMRKKGAPPSEMIRRVVRRSGWILALAYLFRLQQYLAWYPASSWNDVFRVDTLNCIAVSTLLIGLVSAVFKKTRNNMAASGFATAIVVLATPFVYPAKPNLPEFFLSYLNGHNHPSYFSIFPWISFALAGMTFGYLLIAARNRNTEDKFFKSIAVAGICAFAAGSAMSLSPIFEYGFFDYSLTSPHFFLVRLGWLLILLYSAYKWSVRRNADRWSPLRLLGQASIVVYWVHIEIVYGRFFHHYSQALSVLEAAQHFLWMGPLMLGLAAIKKGLEAGNYCFLRILTPARSSKSVTIAE